MPDHITTPSDDSRFVVSAPGPDFRNQRSEDEEWNRREERMAFLAGEGIPTSWDPNPKGESLGALEHDSIPRREEVRDV